MLSVDSILEGLVIDHIKAGKSMEIYKHLGLEHVNCPIAIIKNVKSSKYGKKDIIKIESPLEIDYDVLGYMDPNITVNIIHKDQICEKVNLKLPDKITNVVKCKNPRCITTIENEIDQVFVLSNREKGKYRCIYCQQEE